MYLYFLSLSFNSYNDLIRVALGCCFISFGLRLYQELVPDSELNPGWCDSNAVLFIMLCASFCPVALL